MPGDPYLLPAACSLPDLSLFPARPRPGPGTHYPVNACPLTLSGSLSPAQLPGASLTLVFLLSVSPGSHPVKISWGFGKNEIGSPHPAEHFSGLNGLMRS